MPHLFWPRTTASIVSTRRSCYCVLSLSTSRRIAGGGKKPIGDMLTAKLGDSSKSVARAETPRSGLCIAPKATGIHQYDDPRHKWSPPLVASSSWCALQGRQQDLEVRRYTVG